MRAVIVRNVNQALHMLVESSITADWEEIAPRGGEMTLECPTPFCTTYEFPMERVLFDPVRDANPFFHLFESLWMLAARRDVASLAWFNGRMASYSDNGRTFHGAYGYRLRTHWGVDQLEEARMMLQQNSDTRRCVLSIWDTEIDLARESKDIPCNDLLMFKIREGRLNMTVCCRSNDAIWGAYGANAVHFSMIQEYLAWKVGVPVGVYRQISDSFHVYTANEKWQALRDTRHKRKLADPYVTGMVSPYPIGNETDSVTEWEMDNHALWVQDMRLAHDTWNPITTWHKHVALPLLRAWNAYKTKMPSVAVKLAEHCVASDWRIAAIQWLDRHSKGSEA